MQIVQIQAQILDSLLCLDLCIMDTIRLGFWFESSGETWRNRRSHFHADAHTSGAAAISCFTCAVLERLEGCGSSPAAVVNLSVLLPLRPPSIGCKPNASRRWRLRAAACATTFFQSAGKVAIRGKTCSRPNH